MKGEKDGRAETVMAGSHSDRLGITVLREGINFALFLPGEKECRLNLYNRVSGRQLLSLRLTGDNRIGNIFSVFLKKKQLKKFFPEQDNLLKDLGYLYESRKGEFLDPLAPLVYGRDQFGTQKSERSKLLCGINQEMYDWEEDKPLEHSFQETILYKLHIRGFTKDESAKVSHPGTFLGLTEKLPYLKELGVNALLLQPIYEFEESLEEKGIYDRINYWGYTEDNVYLAPKSAYAWYKEDAVRELKDMVKALHKNGIEVILEMNFAPEFNPVVALECLRYWVRQYHIDGFKLSNSSVPVSVLAADPVLGRTKIISEDWDYKITPERNKNFINYGECNQNFSNTCRKFLRGDEEQVKEFSRQFSLLAPDFGVVKYLTNHDGFTLWDLFSYDRKHNEANKENNRDGQNYNYSWNCGKEGKGSKSVLALRKKQIRNAYVMLLLSQGTPLLLAGDEFCNTQEGNNNPYCQDNKITWLNWEQAAEEKEILEWVKLLIGIRKAHPVFCRREPFRQMDYIACGMPDISFHGTSPWYPDYDHYSRQVGVMLCGSYAAVGRKEFDDTFYISFNFHQEKQTFYLPKAREGEEWSLYLSTEEGYRETVDCKLQKSISIEENSFILEGRAVKVFISRRN